MRNIKSVLIRFNIEDPEHKNAYECLQKRDKVKYRSNSDYVIKAITAFGGEGISDIERIIKKCFEEFMSDISVSRKEVKDADEDIAWEFIGGEKPEIET